MCCSLGLLSSLHIAALVSCAYLPMSPAEAAAAAPDRRQWADDPLLAGGAAGGKWPGGNDGKFLASFVEDGASIVDNLRNPSAAVEEPFMRRPVRAIMAAVLLHAGIVADAIAVADGRAASPRLRMVRAWFSHCARAWVCAYRLLLYAD